MKGIRFSISVFLSLSLFLTPTVSISWAAEHPGTEVQHPGQAITAGLVKKTIRDYIEDRTKSSGDLFLIHDYKLNKEWQLKLDKIHDPVREFQREGENVYFAYGDFKSVDSNDVLDIDFWVVPKGDRMEVTGTEIHKVNGKSRYTYDKNEIKEIK